MNFITLKEKIKEKIKEEPDIIFITKTGSHLFCENCNDYDYVVVINNNLKQGFKIFDKDLKEDYFVKSLKQYNKLLNFEELSFENIFILHDLFKPTYCTYGNADINLDLLGNKDKYKELLKNILPRSYFNNRIKWKDKGVYCHRHFWWIILGLKFIENRSYEITSEIKDIIQQCHDGVLDVYWEDWVKEQLGL